MHNYEKEVEFAKLSDEKKELETLKKIYQEAANKVQKQLKVTNGKIDVMLSELDDLDEGTLSVLRSQIYHKGFQDNLSRQLNGFLNELNRNQYKSIEEYLKASYETGFVGAMYSIANQGIPIIVPIDQKKVVQAIKLNPKLNKDMYTKLGHDMDTLKKRIIGDISRGIAFSDTYDNIARNINNDTRVGFNNAMRIVRTEGHRVQVESAFDAMEEAKSKGADVVKQWNAVLDGRTRPHHRLLDGQIRELNEDFDINGTKVKYPGAFGRPEEDINCRCILSQRARWALDDDELETLRERASYHGLRVDDSKKFGHQKAKDFKDFRKKYLKATNTITDTDKKAIFDYMGSKSYVVNDKLRNNRELTPEEARFTIELDTALDKLPTYSGNLQRSVTFQTTEVLEEFIKQYKVGDIIVYNEYLSTTKGNVYNPEGQVQIYIENAEKGKDISSFNEGEDEVLYKRNSSFRIKNMVGKDGVYYILLVENDE